MRSFLWKPTGEDVSGGKTHLGNMIASYIGAAWVGLFSVNDVERVFSEIRGYVWLWPTHNWSAGDLVFDYRLLQSGSSRRE